MTKLCWVIYSEKQDNREDEKDIFILHVVFSEVRAKELLKEYGKHNPKKRYNWEITTCDE
jgi:hypothetical protein